MDDIKIHWCYYDDRKLVVKAWRSDIGSTNYEIFSKQAWENAVKTFERFGIPVVKEKNK